MDKSNRPRIKLKLQPVDIVFEILGWLALASLWAYITYNYQRLPQVVAIHFGPGGVPDGYGDKSNTFITAGLATGIFLFALFMQRRPHTFNYTETITEENAERQYTIGVRMLRVLKMCICLLFLIVEYSSTVSMAETGKADAKWMFIGIFLLIHLPLMYFVIKSANNK